VVALALLGVETPEAWQSFRGACHRYPRLARAALGKFTNRFHSNWGKHVPDADLGDLYSWLPKISATDEDAESLEPLREFRQNLISTLAARGTPTAVQILDELEAAAPADRSVRRAAAEGRYRYRELSWRPVEPGVLFDLRRSATRRMVQSSEQLLEVVVEAIDAYAALLQGKPPAAEDLWSWTQAKRLEDVEYTPKDEMALSRHLSRYLASTLKGVLVNREVEIAPTSVEPGTGERVDLLVQAVCPETHCQWSVIIEVKASWNPQLQTHLDKQLRNRYLAKGDLRCGIYLVGWYACSQWADHWRRDATRRLNREEVEAFLLERAAAASNGGRSVRLQVLDLTMGRSSGGS
jgi:hypothetical protein